MKKNVFFLLFIFNVIVCKAQYVTIPDSGFAAYLNGHFPNCMVGNQLDTTCNAVVNATDVDCMAYDIYDLTGIVYFDNLQYLLIDFNYISHIDSLPRSLKYFECSNNLLASLPPLPDSLLSLLCDDNALLSLPNLPLTLKYLVCRGNQLSTLPSIPLALETLECDGNNLTYIANLPSSINYLSCSGNQLSSIVSLPDTMYYLDISNNTNLKCLPPIKKIVNDFIWSNTGITCFANSIATNFIPTPPISNIPICGYFNSNNCDIGWKIKGNVFSDVNSNCSIDLNEISMSNVKMNLLKNGSLIQSSYSNDLGQFAFSSDTGIFQLFVDTIGKPYTVDCPLSYYLNPVINTPTAVVDGNDFSIHCKSGFDLGVESVQRIAGNVRPGFNADILVDAGDLSKRYNLLCATGVSGSVKVVLHGPCAYNGPVGNALVPNINGDTLTYTISDFGNVNSGDFSFKILTDVSAQIGQNICLDIIMDTIIGDNNLSNNFYSHCFSIVNSYDPNEKEVNPVGQIDTADYWLNYTVRFQNTGTAPAIQIHVEDTLDTNIDEGSFELVGFSHVPLVQIVGKKVKFTFPNINLPDSTSNEPASHGFVQYKVRRKNNLSLGTQIRNTAYIYFDFNSPVVTNTTTNVIGIGTVGIKENTASGFVLYPNPVSTGQSLQLNFAGEFNEEGILQLLDISGRKVYSTVVSGKNQSLSLPVVAPGVYLCELTINSQRLVRKVVVK